jgi:hypothetical protein
MDTTIADRCPGRLPLWKISALQVVLRQIETYFLLFRRCRKITREIRDKKYDGANKKPISQAGARKRMN